MKVVKKVVLPVAGLGTRLIPITKELPKEMLPIFIKGDANNIFVKPVVQVIFEQLYEVGIRNFCFIVGRNKRVIEDYFTSDYEFIKLLKERNKANLAMPLEDFYNKIKSSTIVFVNQPVPQGFGDAVLRAYPFINKDIFMVHAGDDIILSEDNQHLQRLEDAFIKYNADVAFLLERVDNPEMYGVVVGKEMDDGVFLVSDILEKPKEPPTNIAVIAVYIFKESIFDALNNIEVRSGELQLTDAIRYLLLERKKKVVGVFLRDDEERIDIGTVDSYFHSLKRILDMS
ncbi:MAG: sugar phosphate nucleotidyltransferase [Candidatus Asgardarchaeia archaeon]